MENKYDKIKSFLMEEALKPESRLKMPTVQELMRKFGASQSPVCRAIRDLEKEGVVRCRRGSGMVSCGAAAKMEENHPEREFGAGNTVLFLRIDYFAESLWNMEHTLLSYARQLKLSIINYRMDQSADVIAIIRYVMNLHTLRGIVMESGPETKSDEVIEFLNTLPFPVVLLNSSNIYESAGANVTTLCADSEQAGRLCVEALHRAGHTRIGYIRNEPECDLTRLRQQGINAAVGECGVTVINFPSTIKAWESSAAAAEKITAARLGEIRAERLTALIYFSGIGALAGRRVLHQAGIRVPDEVSVISEDGGSLLALVCPAATVVASDYLQPCRDALDIILGKQPAPGIRRYPYTLIERESIRHL